MLTCQWQVNFPNFAIRNLIKMMSRRQSLILVFVLTVSLTLFLWLIIKDNTAHLTAYTAGVSEPYTPIVIEIKNVGDGYPKLNETDTVLQYTGFHLLYNEEYEQAAWVIYFLTADQVQRGTEDRTENFRADTNVVTGSATPVDYLRSGFDRGHLAPAADMKWSADAMSESFLMSNMSPQVAGFNRGVWSRLETRVREWAVENDSILVITGPVLSGITEFVGGNRVGVPHKYFKIIVDISPPEHKAIAFLLENAGSTADLFSFAVTIDSLERVTGYDFFGYIPDAEMVALMESRLLVEEWR
jgi:endonuclease G, mitochondrial